MTTMRAAVRRRYGSPDVVRVEQVEKPTPDDDQVLVRVHASSVNASDFYALGSMPLARLSAGGLRRPKEPLFGGDFAGVVEAVGKDEPTFRPGDEVYGLRSGAYAEYLCSRDAIGRKPANLSFEEAAAVPIAAVTALQGLRDHGRLEPGQKVLVNGAGGGVGHLAVQIAKALGAEVTAVTSTASVERIRELGADRVLDYTREDFTKLDDRFALILDCGGTKSFRARARVLEPEGTLVLIGAPGRGPIGPLAHIARTWLGGRFSRRRCVFFMAKGNRADLEFLRGLIENGQLKPTVSGRYELDRVGEALRDFHRGGVQGKLVIAV
ncbi:MAG TPA: NAD(P)-dependent alcohol dehydrogenase [Gaiellaceae bacterium]|nr:NAD(P)-dependent alcohol dehydrogenase [Gaiellaceae bacterium]